MVSVSQRSLSPQWKYPLTLPIWTVINHPLGLWAAGSPYPPGRCESWDRKLHVRQCIWISSPKLTQLPSCRSLTARSMASWKMPAPRCVSITCPRLKNLLWTELVNMISEAPNVHRLLRHVCEGDVKGKYVERGNRDHICKQSISYRMYCIIFWIRWPWDRPLPNYGYIL